MSPITRLHQQASSMARFRSSRVLLVAFAVAGLLPVGWFSAYRSC